MALTHMTCRLSLVPKMKILSLVYVFLTFYPSKRDRPIRSSVCLSSICVGLYLPFGPRRYNRRNKRGMNHFLYSLEEILQVILPSIFCSYKQSLISTTVCKGYCTGIHNVVKNKFSYLFFTFRMLIK